MADRSEFDFIRSRLRPLSQGAHGSAHLTDDGAVLALDPGERIAVTADTLVEGRHFPAGEAPDLAARKALRANLSDLAAMGAKPFAYTLSVIWPASGFDVRADGLAKGLADDQETFGIRLIGGDTVVADAPWSIGVTAFGRLPAGASLRRGNCRPGDHLIATGTIGDAGLGLRVVNDVLSPVSTVEAAFLRDRFRLPTPRIDAGVAARALASAAIDISDGLLSEALHFATESGLCAEIELDHIPRSRAAETWLDDQPDRGAALAALASSGDDYELLLSVPAGAETALFASLRGLDVQATRVGRMRQRRDAERIRVSHEGRPITIDRFGFTQF